MIFLTESIYSNIFRNEKFFSRFLFVFSEFRFNFEHFLKKDDPHSLNVFLNLQTSNKSLEKSRFRGPFDK